MAEDYKDRLRSRERQLALPPAEETDTVSPGLSAPVLAGKLRPTEQPDPRGELAPICLTVSRDRTGLVLVRPDRISSGTLEGGPPGTIGTISSEMTVSQPSFQQEDPPSSS